MAYYDMPEGKAIEQSFIQNNYSPDDYNWYLWASANVSQLPTDQLVRLSEMRNKAFDDAVSKGLLIKDNTGTYVPKPPEAPRNPLLDAPLTVDLIASRGGGTVAGQPSTFEEVTTQAAAQDYARLHDPNYWADLKAQQADQLNALNRDRAMLMDMAKNDPSVASLMQLSQGQGPAADAAKAALRQGLDAANAQAMSEAASARGGAGSRALAMRSAIASGAQATQRAANQSQALLAQMALQGVEGLAKQRAENMTMGTALAGLGQQTMGRQGDQTIQAKGQQENSISNAFTNMITPATQTANRSVTAATGVPANAPTVAPGSTAPIDKLGSVFTGAGGAALDISQKMLDRSVKNPTG